MIESNIFMGSANNNLTNKIKIHHVYLAPVKFEDGFDKRIGTNKKQRPVLVLDKIYDHNAKRNKYLVAPIYSVRENEIINDKFVSKYKYHCYIKNWNDSFKSKKQNKYNAKFKITQIQFLEKNDFTHYIKNGAYLYQQIKANSPINDHDLAYLNNKIAEFNNTKTKIYTKTQTITNLYLRRLNIKQNKILTKNTELEKTLFY